MNASQEIISISVILIICVVIFVSCLIIWLIRCRRDQEEGERREKKNEHERELDEYEGTRNKSTPFSQRKVHEVKKKPKKQESIDIEKGQIAVTEASRHEGNFVTIREFETRIKSNQNSRDSIAIKRNKHLDTVSVTATSTDTLQRNDSKNNVFPVERIEEMDLNPGLNSPINLETI